MYVQASRLKTCATSLMEGFLTPRSPSGGVAMRNLLKSITTFILSCSALSLAACGGNVGSAYLGNNSAFSGLFTPCYKDNSVLGSTCYTSKEAYDADQRLKIANQRYAAEQAKPPPAVQKRETIAYSQCVYRSLASGESGRPAFQRCASQGIALCNSANMPTSTDYQIAASGRVTFSNGKCGQTLEGLFGLAVTYFNDELENYWEAKDSDSPYRPFLFDIRKYIEG